MREGILLEWVREIDTHTEESEGDGGKKKKIKKHFDDISINTAFIKKRRFLLPLYYKQGPY